MKLYLTAFVLLLILAVYRYYPSHTTVDIVQSPTVQDSVSVSKSIIPILPQKDSIKPKRLKSVSSCAAYCDSLRRAFARYVVKHPPKIKLDTLK